MKENPSAVNQQERIGRGVLHYAAVHGIKDFA
jgi:hypothetical protein